MSNKTHKHTQTHRHTKLPIIIQAGRNSHHTFHPPHTQTHTHTHTCKEVDANNAGRGPLSFVSAPCCAETACI